MSEELEVSNPDVSGESSTPSEPSSSDPSSDNSQKASSESQSKQEQYVPYTRFQEVIEARKSIEAKNEEMSKQIQELKKAFESQSKSQEASKPSMDPKKVLERLKGIDPEFAQFNEYLMSELSKSQDFQKNLNRQNYLNAAQSSLTKLQSELKVDPVLHKSYLTQISDGVPIEEIEKSYRALHGEMSKYLDGRERSKLASYTEAKKADASVPAPSKGTAPKQTGAKFEYSKNREEARAQMVKRALESMRSNKDAS